MMPRWVKAHDTSVIPAVVIIVVGLILLTNLSLSWGFEVYNSTPGSRAMGMAGVFSAQADDSSAIWYNPAGLKQASMGTSDMTIDISERITSDDNVHFSTSDTAITYAAAYSNNIPFLQRWTDSVGLGIAYHSPYQLAINVNENVDPSDVSSRTYGLINATYQQVSGVIAASMGQTLSIGTTVDMLWADIDCVDYGFCVKNAPYGMGASLGVLYSAYKSDRTTVNLGAVWRSRVSIDYRSTPNSGIGSVLGGYIPDRPESYNLGLNLRYFAPSVLINSNVIIERTSWGDAAGEAPALSNYNKFGVSTELLFPTTANNVVALRVGVASAAAQRSRSPFSHVDTLALGIGVSLFKSHLVDLAWQLRDISGSGNVKMVSVSYSFQYK